MIRVAALYVYPVKGCRGTRVDGADVAERGFEGDRRWMVVDAAGLFVSQRQTPRLVLVRPRLRAGALTLVADGFPTLELAATPGAPDRSEIDVQVWRHRGRAARDAAGSAWFSAFLGAPHHLVFMDERHRRPVEPTAAAGLAPGDIVSFADAFPFLLISDGSLDELNRRLPRPITAERFRPNIVVSGCAPFAEDAWTRLRIGALGFRGVKRCDRCAVTTVDPDTGARGKEPLQTLATFRQQQGKVWFGMNLIHDGTGPLRVGDTVAVEGAAA
jgi:uncharacterized protein YcbX